MTRLSHETRLFLGLMALFLAFWAYWINVEINRDPAMPASCAGYSPQECTAVAQGLF